MTNPTPEQRAHLRELHNEIIGHVGAEFLSPEWNELMNVIKELSEAATDVAIPLLDEVERLEKLVANTVSLIEHELAEPPDSISNEFAEKLLSALKGEQE